MEATEDPTKSLAIPPGATLGMMQPYFLPYTGYFSLIMATDAWIVHDSVQFMKQGWIERNRILKPGEGWQYFSVPLIKHSHRALIRDVMIAVEKPWQKMIFAQLTHYHRRAPHYAEVVEFLNDSFKYETSSITKLNTHLMKAVCSYIGIDFTPYIYSEMNLIHEEVTDPADWALSISRALNARGYINPPGGVELYDREKFERGGINLQFLRNNLRPYNQRRPAFEPALSIIDTMMFCSPEEIKGMISDYELF
jgi:hypothetical protein